MVHVIVSASDLLPRARVRQVGFDERDVWMRDKRLEIVVVPATEKVVGNRDRIPFLGNQSFRQMVTDETGSACNENLRHSISKHRGLVALIYVDYALKNREATFVPAKFVYILGECFRILR